MIEFTSGDTVTTRARKFLDHDGVGFLALTTPCCAVETHRPVWSLVDSYLSGWPLYLRCGRSYGVRAIGVDDPAGCDRLWSVRVTLAEDGLPDEVIWTA
ncbi:MULTISPECIES: hypothetical protein [Actinosynnema]|uniref:hypothetical protein n=1 Tax=Actinosynnema TaxID=40566 RepID=UPI0020A46E00|nr:hypothetical protein [Actinosynnema pretiosum]MCP2099824.1 hypothetical protein [Actinosynnema pretiosum]MCP2099972.1 hypothetical protein [Actinosynnema pretiosum]